MKKLLLVLLFIPAMSFGASGVISIDGFVDEVRCRDGVAMVAVEDAGGNGFDGGTVTLQYEHPNGSFKAVTGASWPGTDPTTKIDTGTDTNFRLNMFGSSDSANVDWYIKCQR